MTRAAAGYSRGTDGGRRGWLGGKRVSPPSAQRAELAAALGTREAFAGGDPTNGGMAATGGPKHVDASAFAVNDPTGKYVVKKQGPYSVVECKIRHGDSIKAEPGAMLAMPRSVLMESRCDGGCCQACVRRCCASETCCLTFYTPTDPSGTADVLISPPYPGNIAYLQLDGSKRWNVQKGAFLVADEDVSVGTTFLGCLRGCCAGEGFFVVQLSGQGRAIVHSYGAILRYDLKAGEERIIDNGFLVAWDADMQFDITFPSDICTSICSGEGIVTKFRGPGTVYVQTRTLANLASALLPHFEVIGGKR